MVKLTKRELSPDDPIFTGGPQIFVPVPRPVPAELDLKTDRLSADELDDDTEGGES